MIKRIIVSLLLLTILVTVGLRAQSVAEQSRELYDKGDFGAAIELLQQELKTQKEGRKESADLYYNLGNSYFRMNELAQARLYYERALLLDPSDRDIRHNIDYLTTKIEDKIPVADTFFVSMWGKSIQNLFRSNTWATMGIVSFLLLVGCLFVFFFTKIVAVKKSAFYIGILFVVVTLFSNLFAFNQKHNVEVRDTAVVMTAVATVHSSPDRNSKDVFTLHSGTKVNITKEDRSWLEIELADGSVGWIEREKIEII